MPRGRPLPWRLTGDEVHHLLTIADAEFRVDVGDVRFHRVLGKHQFFLDEGSRSSLSEEDEYLRFAGRKLVRDGDVFASNRDGA